MSNTGFYIRKFISEASGYTLRNYAENWWPWFRLGEIYLNAAEAAFELDDEPTALPYINRLRQRAGFPANSLTSLTIEKIQNERRVELAFEGHRFWDIRRWKIGAETTKVYGLTITPQNDGSFSYVRSVIQQRGWDDRMNYYPIADAELFKNHNLVQNDGWK